MLPLRIRFLPRDALSRARSATRWVAEWNDEVTVLQLESGLKAFSTVCPHEGGEMECTARGTLRCRWHGARFDTRDGRCLDTRLPPLRPYRVFVESDWIWIEKGAPSP